MRTAWLSATLYTDHRQLLLRDPALVADKLAVLAQSPFDFFRGTLPQWVRDTTEPGAIGALATRLEVPAASHMLLLGDAHLENLGTWVLDDGHVVVDYDDFDAATWGPWLHDVRRLATSLHVYFGDRGLAPEALADAVAAAIDGYLMGLDPAAPDVALGVIAQDLAERARTDAHAPPELTLGPELVPADAVHERLVRALVAAWPASCAAPCGGVVRAVYRRYGAGVASLPLLRWYVALEPDAPGAPSVVVEVREVPPPPALPHTPSLVTWGFAHNAERTVLAQRLFQAGAVIDPQLGFAAIDRWSVRIKQRRPSNKDLSRSRLDARFGDGTWTTADAVALARLAGQRLGQAHRRAPLAPDRAAPAGPVLWSALAPHAALLAAETERFAALMAAQVRADHARLAAALTTHGPLLGWDLTPHEGTP